MQQSRAIKDEIVLSEEDRITYIYVREPTTRSVTEVTNASYETKYAGKWITLVRYDSTHGYLHRHTRLSVHDDSETITPVHLSGSHADWLTWAITDLKHYYKSYYHAFLERSGALDSAA
jgi:hypothetical protein